MQYRSFFNLSNHGHPILVRCVCNFFFFQVYLLSNKINISLMHFAVRLPWDDSLYNLYFFSLFHFFVFVILPVKKIENKHSPKKSRCKTNSAEILFCVIHIRHQSPRVFTFFFCQCLSMVMIIFLSYKVTYIQKKKENLWF